MQQQKKMFEAEIIQKLIQRNLNVCTMYRYTERDQFIQKPTLPSHNQNSTVTPQLVTVKVHSWEIQKGEA